MEDLTIKQMRNNSTSFPVKNSFKTKNYVKMVVSKPPPLLMTLALQLTVEAR
jgi:hypothetical protein